MTAGAGLRLWGRRALTRLSGNLALHLDLPAPGDVCSGLLAVEGWAYSARHRVTSVDAFLDGTPLGRLDQGEARPDVAAALGLPEAETSGFRGTLNLQMVPAGERELLVRARDSGGHSSEVRRRIVVESDGGPAAELPAGRLDPELMRIWIEQPIHQASVVDLVGVTGAVVTGGPPIVRVEARVDAGRVTELQYGVPRPDVERAFPGAANSGFSGTLDLRDLPAGYHTLVVRATDASGRAAETQVIINRGMLASRQAFPPGHFYSPIVDVADVAARQEQIWPAEPRIAGVRFEEERQKRYLAEEFPRYMPDYDYPDTLPPDAGEHQFYTNNPSFGLVDARVLFVMLRSARPRHMIEVGSGYSSLLTADVNQRFLAGQLDFSCIEPYPNPFLLRGVPGISRLIQERVENVPLDFFRRLGENDVLFIDSSHVAKTGSDVNYLVFEVLPRLRPGSLIHFHDITFPADYPKEWVLHDGRSWNELYLVRALLMYSDAFEVLFGSSYVSHYYPELVKSALGDVPLGGGSLWLRRTASRFD